MEDVARLSAGERAELLRRLVELQRAERPPNPVNLLRRQRAFVVVLTTAAVALIPWIVYLGFTLPKQYNAGGWQLAWLGFDILLLGALAITGYLAMQMRQLAIVAAIITGSLLVCDAWFDMTFSVGREEFLVALATALLGELPLAALMFLYAYRMLQRTIRRAWAHFGHEEQMPPLWRLRMFAVTEYPEK